MSREGPIDGASGGLVVGVGVRIRSSIIAIHCASSSRSPRLNATLKHARGETHSRPSARARRWIALQASSKVNSKRWMQASRVMSSSGRASAVSRRSVHFGAAEPWSGLTVHQAGSGATGHTAEPRRNSGLTEAKSTRSMVRRVGSRSHASRIACIARALRGAGPSMPMSMSERGPASPLTCEPNRKTRYAGLRVVCFDVAT